MKRYNFINGSVYDSRRGSLEKLNIAMSGKNIIGLGVLPDDKDDDYEVIDCSGCIIVPNIVDGLVYQSYDSLADLSLIAVNAGVTGLGLFPEDPLLIDSPEQVTLTLKKANEESQVHIHPIGSLTKRMIKDGKEKQGMAELDLMKEAGATAFIDTNGIESTVQMRNILTYASLTGKTVMIRSLDDELSNGGLMNEGYQATILGLKPSPSIAEEIRIARDIQLLEQFGGKIHFTTVSTAKSVALIRQAKKKGLSVTCGTAPYYLYLTDEAINGYNTSLKVQPPLRSEQDQIALIEGIKDGTIDVIASHHRPRSIDEKRVDFESAKLGISGLELLIPLVITKLHIQEKMPLESVLSLITRNVHQVLGIKPKGIALTNSPNFSVINLKKTVEVTEETLLSKGKNTPFISETLSGVTMMTVINGEVLTNRF